MQDSSIIQDLINKIDKQNKLLFDLKIQISRVEFDMKHMKNEPKYIFTHHKWPYYGGGGGHI